MFDEDQGIEWLEGCLPWELTLKPVKDMKEDFLLPFCKCSVSFSVLIQRPSVTTVLQAESWNLPTIKLCSRLSLCGSWLLSESQLHLHDFYYLATFFLGQKDMPNYLSFKKQGTQYLALILYLYIFWCEMEVSCGEELQQWQTLGFIPSTLLLSP